MLSALVVVDCPCIKLSSFSCLEMFCADYIAAFIYHGLFTVGGTQLAVLSSSGRIADYMLIRQLTALDSKHVNQLMTNVLAGLGIHYDGSKCVKASSYSLAPLAFGVASGLAASVTLYPFDFVRGGVLVGSTLRQR